MRLSTLLLLATAITCTPTPSPTSPDTEPEASVSKVTKLCNAYRKLGCEEGQPTPEGATCETVVRNAKAEGIDLVGNVTCVTKATTCDEARNCN